MNYIIPVRPMKDHEHSEQFEEALKKFVTKRIGYNNTFEVFNSVDSRTDALQQGKKHHFDNVRFCTTVPKNCYPGASFSGAIDFNHEIGTYFIEVSADEKFDATGAFYPRIFTQHNKITPENRSSNMQVVGLDYIVKGELKDENQS